MASNRFQYDLASRRYRDTDTGRYLSKATVRNLREAYLDAAKETAAALSERLADQQLTLRQWERGMRATIRDAHVGAAALGGGGRNAMTAADWGAVGQAVQAQYGWLSEFSREIAAGELSGVQVAARSQMYVDAGATAFERARVARIGDLSLPSYPGEDTVCHSRCRCEWHIEEADDEWLATWQLSGSGESCETCLGRAAEWNPLRIEKVTEEERRPLVLGRNGHHP